MYYKSNKIIKIKSVEGISYDRRCVVVSNYIEQNNKDGVPITTKKDISHKIRINPWAYYVSCHETKTMFVFNIRYAKY